MTKCVIVSKQYTECVVEKKWKFRFRIHAMEEHAVVICLPANVMKINENK